MQRFLTNVVVLSVLGLAGCASGLPQGKRTDYSDLPGTRDTARGPGLVSGDHYTSDHGGGTLLYSDDNPQKSVFGSVASHHSGSASVDGASPPAASASAQQAGVEARSRSADYSDFQQFEAYRKFQRLPDESPEKKRFDDWQKWQQYKRWKQTQ